MAKKKGNGGCPPGTVYRNGKCWRGNLVVKNNNKSPNTDKKDKNTSKA